MLDFAFYFEVAPDSAGVYMFDVVLVWYGIKHKGFLFESLQWPSTACHFFFKSTLWSLRHLHLWVLWRINHLAGKDTVLLFTLLCCYCWCSKHTQSNELSASLCSLHNKEKKKYLKNKIYIYIYTHAQSCPKILAPLVNITKAAVKMNLHC